MRSTVFNVASLWVGTALTSQLTGRYPDDGRGRLISSHLQRRGLAAPFPMNF